MKSDNLGPIYVEAYINSMSADILCSSKCITFARLNCFAVSRDRCFNTSSDARNWNTRCWRRRRAAT